VSPFRVIVDDIIMQFLSVSCASRVLTILIIFMLLILFDSMRNFNFQLFCKICCGFINDSINLVIIEMSDKLSKIYTIDLFYFLKCF